MKKILRDLMMTLVVLLCLGGITVAAVMALPILALLGFMGFMGLIVWITYAYIHDQNIERSDEDS